MTSVGHRPTRLLPAWARIADAAAVTLLVVAAAILVFGGGHLHVGSLRLSFGNAWRPALAALALVGIRHFLDRRDPLHRRMWRGLQAAARWSALLLGRTAAPLRRAARMGIPLVVIAVFLVSIAQFYRRDTGFTSFICFGEQFAARALPAVQAAPHYVAEKESGYDGQFYAQLAVEPLLRDRRIDEALDAPPYRARRIFFAWTAYLFGLGRPAWILQAYALENVVAWLLLAPLLLRWFPRTRLRNLVPWFGCLFGSGMIGSVRLALLEGPSMLVLTLAVIAVESNRWPLATGLSAVAGLGRDTNLVGFGLLADCRPSTRGEVRDLAARVLFALLPLFLWIFYVWSLYPHFTHTGWANFAPPFVGYVQKWATTVGQLRHASPGSAAPLNLVTLISLTIQAGFLLWRREWRSPWWRMGVGYTLLMAVLGGAVWSGDPGAAIRVLLPMTFAFNVLTVRSRWFWPLVILGNLSVWHGVQMIAMPWLSPYL